MLSVPTHSFLLQATHAVGITVNAAWFFLNSVLPATGHGRLLPNTSATNYFV